MSAQDGTSLFDLTEQLSRRKAVQTYVPPALASIGALSVVGYKHSGGDTHPNAGRGNGSEGNPDQDPGNSGQHNNANDGGDSPGRGPGGPKGPGGPGKH
jgi:hypothetical protein